MSRASEAALRAQYPVIRYGQVWEDADVMLAALELKRSDIVLSIASGGDNVMALVGAGASRVIALDVNSSQIAALALRVAAYRTLNHYEMLELVGSRPCLHRRAYYIRCRSLLTPDVQKFWDRHLPLIDRGLGGMGKFENYLRLIRSYALPLLHRRTTINALLRGGPPAQRAEFYARRWDNWRWRLMFKLIFSRYVMRRIGRDSVFVQQAKGEVANRMLRRTRHAMTYLNPEDNPYLCWILKGQHDAMLPWALREENFGFIRNRLDRLEWHAMSLDAYLEQEGSQAGLRFDKFNLSDIFEYVPLDQTAELLERVAKASRPGGRLIYWNTLAPRRRPELLNHLLKPREDIARALFPLDRVGFYRALVVEEVL